MKKWAFIDCFEEINFHNIDFSDYERVIFVTTGSLHIPVVSIHPSLEISLVTIDAYSQEQMDHALTFNMSKYDSIANTSIWFDIYSNHLHKTRIESLLKNENRTCNILNLPSSETIILQQALKNLITILNSFDDKRSRPRSIDGLVWRLNNDWRTLRGRVTANMIINELESKGLINHVSNGVYFNI